MRFPTILIVSLFSLLISGTALSAPEKKGVICKCEICPSGHVHIGSISARPLWLQPDIGVFFEKDKIQFFDFGLEKDNVVLFEPSGWTGLSYDTSPEEITWSDNKRFGYTWVLDRQSLAFNVVYEGSVVVERTCEVWPEQTFFKKLNDIKAKYQNLYNQMLKKNKI